MNNKELHNKLSELNQLLEKNLDKFGNYQTFPKSFLKKFNNNLSSQYSINQVRLDNARYQFLAENIKLNNIDIVEFGSNLGYFCLSIAQDYDSFITGYEPIENYSRCSQIISELMECEKKVKFHSMPVKLNDIAKFKKADLLIELNVMHHAGSFFDQESVSAVKDWEKYAINRLLEIKNRYRRIFFQTGNMLNGKVLFPSELSVKYIYNLLKEAKWNIKKIGMISDLSSINFKYNSYTEEQLNEIPQYKCRRDSMNNQVSYEEVQTKKVFFLKTGLANRPLWICDQ